MQNHIPLPTPICVKTIVSAYHRTLRHHYDPSYTPLGLEEIFYVLSGSYKMLVDGEPFLITAGQLLMLPPNSPRCSLEPCTCEVFILTFSVEESALLSQLYNRIITLSPEQHAMLRDIISSSLKILVWHREFNNFGFALKEGTDDFTVQEIKNKIELFLINLMKRTDSQAHEKSLFQRITYYLEAHVHEPLLLIDIANAFSISVSKLSHIFALNGTSPIEYFIGLKMDEAKRLFKETDLTATQISKILGFSTIQYFSKLFSKKCGMSPYQYAKSVRRQINIPHD